MKIVFRLAWLKPGKSASSAFKHPSYLALIDEYATRLNRYAPTEITAASQNEKKSSATAVWLCHPGQKKGEVSSELVASRIRALEGSGTKTLAITIGGPDGFSADELKSADFVWSFGPLTFPHELATLVAVEQIYRAYTINAGTPYHLGH